TSGQLAFNLRMQAEPVADMREIGAFSTDSLCKCYSLVQCKMRNMSFALERIDHQDLASDNFFDLTIVYCLCVCDVSKITYTKAQYGHHIMHHFDRSDLMAK